MSETERIQPQLHYSTGRQGQEGVPEAFKKHRDMGEKLKQWFFFLMIEMLGKRNVYQIPFYQKTKRGNKEWRQKIKRLHFMI